MACGNGLGRNGQFLSLCRIFFLHVKFEAMIVFSGWPNIPCMFSVWSPSFYGSHWCEHYYFCAQWYEWCFFKSYILFSCWYADNFVFFFRYVWLWWRCHLVKLWVCGWWRVWHSCNFLVLTWSGLLPLNLMPLLPSHLLLVPSLVSMCNLWFV